MKDLRAKKYQNAPVDLSEKRGRRVIDGSFSISSIYLWTGKGHS